MRRDLYRHQRSVYCPSQYCDGGEAHPLPGYYRRSECHMLIEDVRVGIMPIVLNRDERQYRIFLKPPNDQFERVIIDAIGRESYSRDFGEAVCEFVRQCAGTVLCFGEACYEIVYLAVSRGDAMSAFDLFYIPREQLRRSGKDWHQIVPRKWARERDVPEIIRIPDDFMARFRLPASMKWPLFPTMECLSSISEHPLPMFTAEEATDPFRESLFNISKWSAQRACAIASATRWVGWPGRGTFRDHTTDYYAIRRQLMFERFKIKLRDQILSDLNEVLRRVGRTLGLTGEIWIEGLPTLGDVASAEHELHRGPDSLEETALRFLRWGER